MEKTFSKHACAIEDGKAFLGSCFLKAESSSDVAGMVVAVDTPRWYGSAVAPSPAEMVIVCNTYMGEPQG